MVSLHGGGGVVRPPETIAATAAPAGLLVAPRGRTCAAGAFPQHVTGNIAAQGIFGAASATGVLWPQ